MFRMAQDCKGTIAILAQKEMAEMAKNVHRVLTDPNGKYKDDRFCYFDIPRTIFNDEELYPNLGGSRIKNMDIFLFHSLRYPKDPNNSLIELYLTIDALTRASVRSITPVVPFLTYSRQDRKDKPRVPISAKAVANMLTISPKVGRMITMDMHSDQGQGFYDIPVDNLLGSVVLAENFRKTLGKEIENTVMVSPDRGSWKRTKRFAGFCRDNMPSFCLDKDRDESGVEFEDTDIRKYVEGKTVLMIDDQVATGDTFIGAGQKVVSAGAKQVIQAVTHWVACPKNGITAEEKFRASGLHVVTTDTIPRSPEYLETNKDWLTMVPIYPFLANVIHESTLIGGSISQLFVPTK